ncbi:hypothetical protein HZS_5146 [Henneguya salminicola]|nr:hypothetical protein HZS_5146 [Henneguya salminicola]
MSNVKKDIVKRKAYSSEEWRWLDGEELKLREYVHNLDDSCGLSRKRARTAKDVDLDTVIFTWFVQQHHGGSLYYVQ